MIDDADAFLPPTQESIWKVTRQLKKEQSSLYNCVASILSDAAFVSEVRALYPSLPLLANLRCGLWYTRQADGTCYYKSTDGHNGNWSFSCTRINWHVCELAAKHGGVIIVDATRKGKRFPDAMTKTIPIWAAVVNRAVASKRAEAAARLASSRSSTAAPKPNSDPENAAISTAGATSCLRDDPSPAAATPSPHRPASNHRQNRSASGCMAGGDGGCGDCTNSPPPPGGWAPEGDIISGSGGGWGSGNGCSSISYGRVGSLSQWLPIPMVAAAATTVEAAAEADMAAMAATPMCAGSPTHHAPAPAMATPPPGQDPDGTAAAAAASGGHGCNGVTAATAGLSMCTAAEADAEAVDGREGPSAAAACGCCDEVVAAGLITMTRRSDVWCGTDPLSTSELQEEVSFGSIEAADNDGDLLSQQQQPLAIAGDDAVCGDRNVAVVPALESGGLLQKHGIAQAAWEGRTSLTAEEAAEAEAPPPLPFLPAARMTPSPFALVAAAAAAAAAAPPPPSWSPSLSANVPVELGSELTAPSAAAETAVTAAAAVEPADSVDLGAASASHVSCSPEEGWRRSGLFGGVVDDQCGPDLQMRCDCGSWECPAPQSACGGQNKVHPDLDNNAYNRKHDSGGGRNNADCDLGCRRCITPRLEEGKGRGEVETQHRRMLRLQQEHRQQRQQLQEAAPCRRHRQRAAQTQRQGRQQHLGSDGDVVEVEADVGGSGGSCSDTCGPASGPSGLISTRSSASSSSSSSSCSLCGSRSSSGSSTGDQSDHAAGGTAIRAAWAGGVALGGGGVQLDCADTGCPPGPEPAPEPAPRLRPFPPHQNAGSPTPPPPSRSGASPRRCGAVPPPPRPGSCSGVGSRLGHDSGSCSAGSLGGGCACACGTGACKDAGNGVGHGDGDGVGDGWDVGLHLPLWISSNERAQIERRLDGWVDALLRVGADVEGLAKVLRKPLRPLWISQSSTIWVDQVAQPDQLPFTPLYLVSASQPHSYLRQVGRVGEAGGGGGGGGSDADGDGDSSDERHAGAIQRRHHKHRREQQQQQQQQQQQPHAWTYVYVPGAGDDEESWAAGLAPAVFWAHYTELLQAGPTGVYNAVHQILRREAAALAEHGANSTILAAAAAGAAAAAAAPSSYSAPTDKHHLLPAGCRATALSNGTGACAPAPRMSAGGLFFIGRTGIALGDLAAGAAPGCWEYVDAVLCCGTQQHPSMAGEPQWPLGDCGEAGGLKVEPNEGQRLVEEGEEEEEEVPLPDRDRHEPSPHHHRNHHHHHHHHHHHGSPRARRHLAAVVPPRYLHLPVKHFKYHRTSLGQHLDTALDFLTYHLSRGRKVLIHDTNGLDTCVCVAVALLLACYGPCGSGGETSAKSRARCYQARLDGARGEGGSVVADANMLAPGKGEAAAAAAEEEVIVTKDAVRQHLAYVSAFYPPARPTRGMLRQVYNHFVRAGSGAGGAGGPGAENEMME